MPAAARRFDDKRIPGMNRNRVTAFKVYYGFIAAYDVIAARHSGFAAGHAIRTNGAMSGHECGGHGFENSSSNTGYRDSSTSGSVSREFVIWVCTTSVPSKPSPAPDPPAMVS